MQHQQLARGFVDPVRQGQAVFRAAMQALARPGCPQALAVDLTPPAPLSPEAAALVLALCDYETPLWLDAPLARPEVRSFVSFHTGAPLVEDPALARFAVIADPEHLIDFAEFSQGSPAFPDSSATLILQMQRLSGSGFALEGPGLPGRVGFGAEPLPADFAARMAANRAGFPLGVDLLLVAAGRVAGLPRSTRILQPVLQEA